jgi:hypothetical protein
VSQLESVFPLLERLGTLAYMHEPTLDGCEYLQYSRGAFSTDPASDTCWMARGSDEPIPSPVEFDGQATIDVGELRSHFAQVGAPIRSLYVDFRNDGTIAAASFSVDGCITYYFEPGWTELPKPDETEVSTRIDSMWYQTDYCPR